MARARQEPSDGISARRTWFGDISLPRCVQCLPADRWRRRRARAEQREAREEPKRSGSFNYGFNEK